MRFRERPIGAIRGPNAVLPPDTQATQSSAHNRFFTGTALIPGAPPQTKRGFLLFTCPQNPFIGAFMRQGALAVYYRAGPWLMRTSSVRADGVKRVGVHSR